jgi:outer membrane receptor protein involved in Fe transport
MKRILTICLFLLIGSITSVAQKTGTASIKGVIIDKSSDKPLEFVNVIIRNKKDSTFFQGAVTDRNGVFEFEGLPFGEFKISYSFIGFDKTEYTDIALSAKKSKVDIGKLYISETSNSIAGVDVIGQKSTFVNSIDRKTFNVGQDLISKTGSVSELLQNVPSVQVDIDGNVALRGSDNVTILINGKPSALMGANRAAVLQQMPANSIEKIEVITNPSAKYKPDGTSGIINIVIKKNKSLGLNGSISANAGNDNRYNGNFILNYNPGKLNIFGSYSIRQDDRLRLTDDYRKRTKIDTIDYYQVNSTDHSRPISNIVRTGFDYKLSDHNKIGISGSYNYRDFTRRSRDKNLDQESIYPFSNSTLTKKYDRLRLDPEYEMDMEFTGYLQHTFAKEGHELNFDITASRSREQEDNRYINVNKITPFDSTFDNTLIRNNGDESQISLEYVNPITEDIKFESGYNLESQKNEMNFLGSFKNSITNLWENDLTRTNNFIYTENIHVLYATFEQDIDEFGYLVGLRAEQAFVKSDQVTNNTIIRSQYFRLYPSLHLSYKLSEKNELQLNYSHRIRRPESEDMNPFSEGQDPLNIRVGNPDLKPADIHSIELGYQFKKNKTTFLSTVYYRYTYNGMTDTTGYINDTVKVTRRINLSKSGSAGLELVLSTSIGEFANINLSTNTFYYTIDASNLGYSKNKSIIAWSTNFSSGFNLTKSSVLQLTSSYSAERLTPQGKQLPSFVLNFGFKQEVFKKKGAIVLTCSDVLNSLRNNTIVETPELYEKIIRKRSARLIYIGFTYSFGNSKKREKESAIKFDNQI